jgi:hypothetical protein
MSYIDDIYFKKILENPFENFTNELITHKVSKIDCNFIEFIINKSPEKVKYLDIYYNYFNQIDMNIIKNTRNSQNQLLIEYYRNINIENIKPETAQHISFFVKRYEITNNIMDLFVDNNTDNEINNNIDNENDVIFSIKNDINQNKQDIINIRKKIDDMKNDIDAKFNKIFNILSNPNNLNY